ncbi:hypothetical protein GCM10009608_09020 [Pseudonocardia alaniniphila]
MPAPDPGQNSILPNSEGLVEPGENLGLQPGEPPAEGEKHFSDVGIRADLVESFSIVVDHFGVRTVRCPK